MDERVALDVLDIRVSPQFLDNVVIKMAGVAHEMGTKVVGVFDATEDGIYHRGLAALA